MNEDGGTKAPSPAETGASPGAGTAPGGVTRPVPDGTPDGAACPCAVPGYGAGTEGRRGLQERLHAQL